MGWKGSIAAITLVVAGAAYAQQERRSAVLPGWMAGCWAQVSGEKWAEECWMQPRGGAMLGMGRGGVAEQLGEWEAMQILPASDGRLTYWASPKGGPRVAFPMISQEAAEIVFADPTHDYPQRIRYWRTEQGLNAEISLIDGSKKLRWTYQRAQ